MREGAPWLDKRAIAAHLSCSVRSIESALAEGMPHAVIFGRPKFKIAQAEAWLEQAGHLEIRGDWPTTPPTILPLASTLRVDNKSARPRDHADGPGRREASPHVSTEA